MGDLIRVRGEGGAEFTLSLPLDENISAQLEKGLIVEVSEEALAERATRSSGK